jgi:hypothetical protein
MGKVKRLELWWQLCLYVTSRSGLRKKPAITLCAFECTNARELLRCDNVTCLCKINRPNHKCFFVHRFAATCNVTFHELIRNSNAGHLQKASRVFHIRHSGCILRILLMDGDKYRLYKSIQSVLSARQKKPLSNNLPVNYNLLVHKFSSSSPPSRVNILVSSGSSYNN